MWGAYIIGSAWNEFDGGRDVILDVGVVFH